MLHACGTTFAFCHHRRTGCLAMLNVCHFRRFNVSVTASLCGVLAGPSFSSAMLALSLVESSVPAGSPCADRLIIQGLKGGGVDELDDESLDGNKYEWMNATSCLK